MFTNLPTRIQQCAHDAGFDLCGIAPVRDFGELTVFPDWIADGKHGEMKYMEARDEAGELKRASLARVAPWARSVIVCAINYNTAHPYSTQTDNVSRGSRVTCSYKATLMTALGGVQFSDRCDTFRDSLTAKVVA